MLRQAQHDGAASSPLPDSPTPRLPDSIKGETMNADQIKTVAVVGAGTMGPGIAATFARHGFATRLFDVKPEQLEKAKGTVDFVYSTLVRGGFMSEADIATG